MKNFLLTWLLAGLFLGQAQAQTPATLPDSLHYSQVVPVPGASADDLYARAREWVALTFEDGHQVVQLDDPQRHLLLGSGYTQFLVRRSNGKVRDVSTLWFRFRIEAREGRYRVEISDLGAPYNFSGSSAASLPYAAYEHNRWVQSGFATQVATERHLPLSRGFLAISVFPTPEVLGQIKAGIEEATQLLLASLRKTETAPPAKW